jgi:hypothetical protein
MDENAPANFVDLMVFAENEFGKTLQLDSLRHWVRRNRQLKSIQGKPQETERLNSSDEAIDTYFQYLDQILQDFPAALVINLDETGHQEWADRTEERVIVPVSYTGSYIDIPIDRSGKRSTLLGAIAADGTTLTPMIIVQRETIEAEMYQAGYTPEKVMYAHQPNGFIDTDLFDAWCEQILFPYIEATRERLGYHGKALVLIDGCSAHYGEHFTEESSWRGVHIVFLPPHTSDQTQPMDLGIFGVQKAEASRIRPRDGLIPQTKAMIKALGGYHKATTASIITSAFRRAGIVVEWNGAHRALTATVCKDGARNIRHWQWDKTRVY